MYSTNAISLSICLHVEVGTYIIPVIPKFRTQSLVLKGIWNTHSSRDIDISHYPKGYILIPSGFKRISCGFAVIEERNSSEYWWKLFSEEAVCQETFIKIIKRYFIQKFCVLFVHRCLPPVPLVCVANTHL